MEYALTVFERLTLLQVLPTQGSIVTLRVVQDLRQSLALSSEEIVSLDVHEKEGKVFWRTEADHSKAIEIGSVARSIIKDKLEELNAKQLLTMDHVPLYERFVEQAEEAPHV
jgi:hypothetical protein